MQTDADDPRRGPAMGVSGLSASGATILAADQDPIPTAGDVPAPPTTPETLPPGAGWPLHPFLFGAAAVVSLFAANLRETALGDIGAALAGVLASALVLLVGFGAALRSLGPRAAILASIVLVGGLHYADAAQRLNRFLGVAHPEEVVLPWALGAIALTLVAVWRVRSSLVLPNAMLNGIAAVMLAVPVGQVAAHAWTSAYDPSAGAPSRGEAVHLPPVGSGTAAAPPSGQSPDIHYLIFDRYASQSVLATEYGLDNRDFIDFLEARGFYVASGSHSNYPKTATSLASSLSMDYINFLSARKAEYGTSWQPIYAMLGEHRVGRFLKERGYHYVQIGSWWNPTRSNAFADESYSFGLSEFDWVLLQKSIVPPLLAATVPGSGLAMRLRWDHGQCQRVPQQMAQILRTGDRPQPTFLFAHILLPHEPYVFAADGRCLSRAELDARGSEAGYVGQIRYTNRLLEDLLAGLLDRPGPKPVIILQADEGPFPERYRASGRSWREADPAELRMKTAILNAYYFPGGDYSALYDEITPVNSFRIVFNKFFETKFERLPDKIYASPDVFQIYEFFDVTEIVRGDSN